MVVLDRVQVEEPKLTSLIVRVNAKVVIQILMVMIVDSLFYVFFIGLSIFLKIIK